MPLFQCECIKSFRVKNLKVGNIKIYRVNHKTFVTVYMLQIINFCLLKTLHSLLIKIN